MFSILGLKDEYKNKKLSEITLEELMPIIEEMIIFYINKYSNVGHFDCQKGYFIGDRPPFDQNAPICSIDNIK